MRRLTLLALPLLAVAAVALAEPYGAVESAWSSLPTSESTCEDFDYFPDGGMQNFWCHTEGLLPIAEVQRMAGMPIWTKGPHRVGALDLDNGGDFGHYNPQFVTWMEENLIAGLDKPVFKTKAQGIYDTSIRKLARVHHLVWLKAKEESACTLQERSAYERKIAEARQGEDAAYYYERWFYFLHPSFCTTADKDSLMGDGFDSGYDGNVVKTATGFWLRRQLDGTEDEFHAALLRLLKTYDNNWVSTVELPDHVKAAPSHAKPDAGGDGEKAQKKKKGKKGKKGK